MWWVLSVFGRIAVPEIAHIVIPAFPDIEVVIELAFVPSFLLVRFTLIIGSVIASFPFVFHTVPYNHKA